MSQRRWKVQIRLFASVEALKARALVHPGTAPVRTAQRAILLQCRKPGRRSKNKAKRFESSHINEPYKLGRIDMVISCFMAYEERHDWTIGNGSLTIEARHVCGKQVQIYTALSVVERFLLLRLFPRIMSNYTDFRFFAAHEEKFPSNGGLPSTHFEEEP